MPTQDLNLNRFREGGQATEEALAHLEAGRLAARQGRREEAARWLRAATRSDPTCADAWLGLAWLAATAAERETYLRRVLDLVPGHAKAQEELARLQRAAPPGTLTRAKDGAASRSRRRRFGLWVWIPVALASVLAILAFLVWGPVDNSLASLLATPTPVPTPTLTPAQVAERFAPQLEKALAFDNWDRAFELLDIMRSLDPSGDQVLDLARTAHVQYGQVLLEAQQIEEALVQFDSALAAAPNDPDAGRWQSLTATYLAGQDALTARQWDLALESFAAVHDVDPDFVDVSARLTETYRRQGEAALEAEDWTLAVESLTEARDRAAGSQEATQDTEGLLARAYLGRGIAEEEAGRLEAARADLEAALALRPDDAGAQEHLDAVMNLLFPPKLIEIDISKQRLFAWEGDRQVFKFVVSTGLPGRDTAAGRFKVLDKIPLAYSSVWRLKMPNWLGIYYVKNIENGIHALPIRPDGTVMWAGLLGQKASYGCIILDNDDAQALYAWAEVGTAVHIHY